MGLQLPLLHRVLLAAVVALGVVASSVTAAAALTHSAGTCPGIPEGVDVVDAVCQAPGPSSSAILVGLVLGAVLGLGLAALVVAPARSRR